MDDLTPVTRTERLLDGEDLTPTNREEMFIKRIYDKTQEIPEPVNRKEYFLKKAGEAGGDVTVVPLSVTSNGTYSEEGKAYTPVNVAVEGYALKALATPSEVASFNAAELPLNKLKVGINAVQDLHGYDHPWVGGAGKNKLPMTVDGIKALNTSGTWNNNTYSINGGTLTIMTDNSGDVVGINVNGNFSSQTDIRLVGSYGSTTTFIGQGSYYINCANAITETEIHYGYGTSVFGRLNNTSDKRVDITGSNLGMSFVMLRLLNGTQINVTLKPMIRLASETDATFEPYSNICPISGWDEANISDVGKNLLNYDSFKTSSIIRGTAVWENNGVTLTASANDCFTNYESYPTDARVPISEGQTITLSWKETTNTSGNVIIFPNGILHPSRVSINNRNGKSLTYTAVSGVTFVTIRFGVSNGGDTIAYKDIQIEYGSTDTEYVPYVEPNLYTISLGQTVYGGELDVVNGVLTITHEYIASYNGETLPSTWISSMDVYAEGTTPTIGAEVCYERANPISTNLTPTLIKSLNGQNNLSVDCGEVMECEWLESL